MYYEGIPTLDMVKAVAYVYNRPGVRLIGPNCPELSHLESQVEQKSASPGHIHAKVESE